MSDTAQVRTLALRWRLLLAAAAGALLVLAFPPFGFWPLSLVAVAALALLVLKTSWRAAAVVGGTFGMAFFLGLMPWLRVIGLDAWIGLSLLCAAFLAVLAVGLSVVGRTRWWPLAMAGLWVAVEAVRDRFPLGGFPWGRLAFAHSDSPFTGWVALGGAPLVTFTVALSGCLLAYAVASWRSDPRPVVVAVVAAMAVAVVGVAVPRPTDGETITAAVVQGNVPRTGMDAFGQQEAVLRGHVDATLELAAEVAEGRVAQPDLVVWPENSSDIDPFRSADAFELIDDAVRAVGVDTLVGVVVETEDGERLENTGVVWSPVDGPGERYVKRHPVPFGEYVPFRAFLSSFISRFDRVPRDFVAGDEPGVMTVGPAVVGNVICFEVAYDEVVRDVVREGGEIITVQTNNATYGRTGQVEQQLAMSQLRAVEHGRTVLVAATSGISAVIAPDGTVQQRAPEFTREVLVDDVVLRDSSTLATWWGAVPEYLLAIVGLLGLTLALRRGRREREV
jgi:apolipoprotein N-acyltransferase